MSHIFEQHQETCDYAGKRARGESGAGNDLDCGTGIKSVSAKAREY